MKRIAKISVIMLLVLIMSPLAAFAAPEGYMEVEMTKNNFNKYFEYKKVKHFDAFGDYNGYSFQLYSKLLNQGYYVYKTNDFAIKGKYNERYKYTYKYRKKRETYKDVYKGSFSSSYLPTTTGWRSNDRYNKYNYNYAKITKFKINKIRGSVVFIEPSNVIAIEYMDVGSLIKLRHPYDSNMSYETRWDEASGKWVIDYYYTYSYDLLDNGKKDKILIR